jgi:hypothetical protein
MCQHSYDDTEIGYEDDDDGWGDDGYGDGPDDDGDYYDRDERDGADYFDEADYEFAREYAEHQEHCERVHGGGECYCRPPWWRRAWCWLVAMRPAIRTRLKRPRRYNDDPPF